jgi:hypothetical protein
MTVQTLYLAMVLAAFAGFMGTLGFVSIWSRLGDRARASAARKAGAAPTRPALAA